MLGIFCIALVCYAFFLAMSHNFGLGIEPEDPLDPTPLSTPTAPPAPKPAEEPDSQRWSRRPALLLVVLGLLAPGAAFADVAVPPAPGLLDTVLAHLPAILGVLTMMGGLIGGGLGLKQHLGEARQRQISTGAYYAYHITEDLAAELPEGKAKDSFSKVSEGFKQLDDYFKAQGWRTPKPGELEVAAKTFTVLASLDNQAKARVAQVALPSPVPTSTAPTAAAPLPL